MATAFPCKGTFNGQTSEGTAALEVENLVFQGSFELRIPLSAIESVEAVDGFLHVTSPEGVAVFELGDRARRWANRIRKPRTLSRRLGVGLGCRVSVVGLAPESFLEQLREYTNRVTFNVVQANSDVICLFAEDIPELRPLPSLLKSLVPGGEIWVIYPKRNHYITQADIVQAASAAGLSEVKTVKVSEVHSGLKLVVPGAKRPRKGVALNT